MFLFLVDVFCMGGGGGVLFCLFLLVPLRVCDFFVVFFLLFFLFFAAGGCEGAGGERSRCQSHPNIAIIFRLL